MTASRFIVWYRIGFPAEWRLGQAAFNRLLDVRPDLAERIRGTDLDPYFESTNSECLALFESFILENWD